MDNLVAKQQLTAQELQLFTSEMNSKTKNPTVAWILWFFLSGVGGHQFYLGKPAHAIGYIALNLLGYVTFFITWVPWFIWWILDAVTMNDKIKNMNNETERKLLDRILSSRQ